MKFRASILVLAALAQTAGAQLSTHIVQSNNVDTLGRSGQAVRWFQSDTVQYDIYARSGSAALDVTSASFPVWYVVDRANGVLYVAKTGTIVSATNGHARISLSKDEANLPERMYESIVRLYAVTNGSNVEVRTIARSPAEVQWSADATNYPLASGLSASNLIFNITVTSSGSGTNADITAVVAGTLLSGGGVTGDVTVHLDTASADARWINEAQASAISNAMLAAGSVTSNKIDWTTMPSGLEDGDQVGSATTNAGDLVAGTLNTNRLPSTVSQLGQTIESSEITDGTITSNDIDAATDAAYRSGGGGSGGATNFGLGLSGNGFEIPVEVTNSPRWGGLSISQTGSVAGYVFRWDGTKAYIGPDDSGTAAATNAVSTVGVSTQLVGPLSTLLFPPELFARVVSLGGGTGIVQLKGAAQLQSGSNGFVRIGNNQPMTIGSQYQIAPSLIVGNSNSTTAGWDNYGGAQLEYQDTRGSGSAPAQGFIFTLINYTSSGAPIFSGAPFAWINADPLLVISTSAPSASVSQMVHAWYGVPGDEWYGYVYGRSLTRGSGYPMSHVERPFAFRPAETTLYIGAVGTSSAPWKIKFRGARQGNTNALLEINTKDGTIVPGDDRPAISSTNEVPVMVGGSLVTQTWIFVQGWRVQ